MPLRKRIIEGDCLFRCGYRAWKSIGISVRRILPQQIVGIGQAGIGSRVTGIVHDRLREQIQSPMQTRRSSLIPLVPATKVELVGNPLLICGHRQIGSGRSRATGQKTSQLDG